MNDPEELSRGAIAAVRAYFKQQGVELNHAVVAFDVVLQTNEQENTVARLFGAPAWPATDHLSCHLGNLGQAMGILDGGLVSGLVQLHFDGDGDVTHIMRVGKKDLAEYYAAIGLTERPGEEPEPPKTMPEGTRAWLARLRQIRSEGSDC